MNTTEIEAAINNLTTVVNNHTDVLNEIKGVFKLIDDRLDNIAHSDVATRRQLNELPVSQIKALSTKIENLSNRVDSTIEFTSKVDSAHRDFPMRLTHLEQNSRLDNSHIQALTVMCNTFQERLTLLETVLGRNGNGVPRDILGSFVSIEARLQEIQEALRTHGSTSTLQNIAISTHRERLDKLESRLKDQIITELQNLLAKAKRND